MPKKNKRKVSDDTFYVTRHMGRLLGSHQVFRDGGSVGVGVSGGLVSSTLLWVLHLRHRWVPVRTELVPIHLGPGPIPDELNVVCHRIGADCRVLAREPDLALEEQLVAIAADLGLDAMAVGQVIEDRAAAVLGSLGFDGALTTLPTVVKAPGRPTLVRPFAKLPEDAVLRAATDNAIEGRAPRRGRDREWMEKLLSAVPGDRHVLLANLVNAPERVKKDYLV